MYHRVSQRLFRVVLPFVLAVFGLAILLGLFAGPGNIVHAFARRVRVGADEHLASIEIEPPSGETLASPRPPQEPPQQVLALPTVWTVCAAGCNFTYVQDAVDAAAEGDTIKVAQGTYTDDDLDGYVVEITEMLTLLGGFTTTNWDVSDPDANPTVLDGQATDRVIYVGDDAAPTIEGFEIESGFAGNGAGVYVASGNPTFARNRIHGNTADQYGGGLYVASGNARIENCLIYDNTADKKRGGGLYVAAGSSTIRFNVFYGNQSQEQGGGIYVGNGSPTIVGNIFSDNVADPTGGGIYVATGLPTIDYNDYYNNTGGFPAGLIPLGSDGNSIPDDPSFANVPGRDFHLNVGSPCMDKGDPTNYPATDYDGLGRPFGTAPDMGAYEIYAGTCFARAGNGQVRSTVQQAVDEASAGQEVKVAGVCTGTGTSPVVNIDKNLVLRGGYTLTNWTDPDPDLYVTILDGEVARRVIDVANLVDVTIEGFHIRNGYATSAGGGIRLGSGDYVIRQCRVYLNESDGEGGGVSVVDGAIRVESNQIYSNTSAGCGGGGISIQNATSGVIRDNEVFENDSDAADGTGGCGGAGLLIKDGTVTVEDNRFYLNYLDGYGGGGMHIAAGNSTIIGNKVYSNTQTGGNNGGGGIFVYGGSLTVERNAIYGNSADASVNPGGGGGIYVEGGDSVIRNNLIYSNTVDSDNEGGGIFRYYAGSTIENNTFYGNQAGISGSGGGGIYDNSPGGDIRNNIVVNNSGGQGVYPGCEYCDVWGNSLNTISGTGSISVDPLFVQPGVDFRLQSGSQCRDNAGTPYPDYDYDGYARPYGATADIGAHEYYTGTCFARLGTGSVYATVQDAIDAAGSIGPIYVAGVCTASGAPVATIDEQFTLRGGYTLTNWLTPSTGTYLVGDGSRVVEITGTGPVTVDGFIIQNGSAAVGAGLYIASAVDARVQNMIFYDNAASGNGILASVGGNSRFYNNTFVDNSVGSGGIVHISGGSPIVSNTIIVSNTGSAISGASCNYCFVNQDPGFVNYAGDDFHLRSDSPCIYAGDPNTDLDHDFEGDPRKLGNGYDIGADECAAYPGLLFEPQYQERYDGAPGRTTVYTYVLTNTGGVADVFDLTYSLQVTGTGGWNVNYDPSIDLDGGASTVVQVDVIVPTDEISGAVGTVILTATSQLNPALYEVVTNVTYISWNPGVTITPVYTGYLNPGDVITYVHTLINTGNAPDSFTVTFSSLRGWSGITPTVVSSLDPGASATLWFTIEVPSTMPGGVTETVVITAVNSSQEAWAVITNAFEINHVPGDRYVFGVGNDTDNNCLVASQPCQTVGYAVGQAATGDTVKVAPGVYREFDLLLNKAITVAGGYTTNSSLASWWGAWNPDPRPDPERNVAVIDAEGHGRVIEIWGNPTVFGLTLRGGWTAGSGGGVYIGTGSPVLRKNTIVDNAAANYGGGVYNWFGTPKIEQNVLGNNTANRGGGFATMANTFNFYNNVLYGNSAMLEGGGMYVLDGSPKIWHGTFYDNDAPYGGGLYLAGNGSPVVWNTIIVTNTATIGGGGVYSQAAGAAFDYNNWYGNVPGNYVGLSAGPHSVAYDPLFLEPNRDDLHLRPNSPVSDIAAGSAISEDLDGDPRSIGFGPDIGADEFAWGTIEFTPHYSGMITHCFSIAYTHLMTHTGRYTDTFGFVVSSTQDVVVTIIPPQVTLGHNMTTTVDVIVTAPCTLTGPLEDTTVITAVSLSYSFITSSVVVTTYIDVVPLLEFEPDQVGYGSPGPITYTHTLTNAGNYTDTISLDYWSQHGWGVTVSDTVVLGPNSSTIIIVVLSIPGGAVSGTVETTYITATSMFSYPINGIPMSATVVNTTTVGPQPAVDVWQDPSLLGGGCYWGISGPPFTATMPWTTDPFRVYNQGNLTDTFELSTHLEVHLWTMNIVTTWVTITETPPISITLPPAPNSYKNVWVRVAVPAGSENMTDTLWLTATSQADNTVSDSEQWRIVIANGEVDMSPDVTQAIVYPDQSVSYQRALTNTSTFVTDIDVTFCESYGPPAGWVVQFPPVMENVPVGGVRNYTISITVPTDVSTATEKMCFTARTLNTCLDWYNIAVDTIMVRRPGVTIVPDRNPAQDPEATVIPGTVITYTYVLSNSGAWDDWYTLTWTPNPNPAWPTWTVTVSPPTSPWMSPTDQITVVAVMTIPDGMPVGVTGRLIVTATSSYTTTIYDIAVADMVVPPLPMARITPNHTGVAWPGQYITYTHILTNVGNVTDWFTITTNSSFAVAEVLPPSSVQLAPMEAYTQVVVRLYIPPHAEIGSVEETRVIVSFGEPDAQGMRPQAVAIDLTTIQAISGTRYVSPDGRDEGNNCVDQQFQGSCRTIQHAVDQAWPGDEVRVARGTYTDVHSTAGLTQVVYLDKSLVLRGGYTTNDWNTFDPSGNPTILDAGQQGRVIYVAPDLMPTIAGFYLTGGYVDGNDSRGAGIYTAPGTVLTIERNVIHNNVLVGNGTQGGGIYYGGPDGILLRQNTLHDNSAEDGSGAYLAGSDANVWNNVFHSNDASSLGGGLFLNVVTAQLWNNTFYSNTADSGGGVYYDNNGTLVISNTIFAENIATVAGGGLYVNDGTPALDYNDYWNNVNGDTVGVVSTGTNSFAADPLFVNEATFDLYLTADSPCKNAGDPDTALSEDRDGKVRPLLGGYDVGAYEYGLELLKVGQPIVAPGDIIVYTILVTNSSNLPRTGVVITDALSPDLDFVPPLVVPPGQSGEYIAASRTVSWTVSVSENSSIQLEFTARVTDNLAVGTVISNAAWIDNYRTDVITSVYRTCWVRLNNDPTDYTTVQAAVDASQDIGDEVKVAGTCSTVHARQGISQVVYLSKTLTIQGGYTRGNWNTPDPRANPTTLDAMGQGRAIYITGDISPTIEGLRLTGGDASGLGGLAAGDAGGGVYVVTATATLQGNVVWGNTAGLGGGVCLVDSASTLINNAIIDNQANTAGSGLYVSGNNVTMLHNTLARNGGAAGHGIYVTNYGALAASVALTNTVMATHTTDVFVTAGNAATFNGVLWWPGRTEGGTGSRSYNNEVTGDPAFYPDGYHLTVGSSARDQGVDAGVVDDIDGDSRLGVGLPDLGADEIAIGLAISKSADPDPVSPGQQLDYTIRVTNTGAIPLDVIITDTLPAQVIPSGLITWDLGTLAPDQVAVRTFTVTVATGYDGPLVNRVDATSTDGVTATYTLTTYAEGNAVLTVTKDVEPAFAEAGEQITYTIYVTNQGDVDLNLTVTDTPPADVTPNTPQVWTPPTLVQGGTWSTTLVVTANFGYQGVLTNVVSVTSPEGASGIYTATSYVGVTPAVSITKVASADPVQAGDTLTYTIYVTNTGNVTLTATITDYLPTDVTPGGVMLWTQPISVPNGVWSTTVAVLVDWGYQGWLTNIVVVEDTGLGVSDAYTLYTWVDVTPAVTVTKVASDDPVQAGDMLTYTIYVTNTGNVTLTATITDYLPDNAAPGGTQTWPTQQLGVPGGTWSATVYVTPDLGYQGWLTNVVEVADTTAGVREVYTLTTWVDVTPAVTVTKVASQDPVQAGDMLTYTIYVTNTGNVTLTATITDYLPDNAAPGGTQTWPTQQLGVPGGTWSATVYVTPDLGYQGWLTNVVEVADTTAGVREVYTLTTWVDVTPAVTVTKVASQDPVNAGDMLTYTIYVTNTGNVTLTATITEYYPANATSTVTDTWTGQELGVPGGTWSTTVHVTPNLGYAGWLTNVVVVSTTEGASAAFTDTVLSMAPYLSVTKQVSADPVQAGDVLTYTIYVTNTGTMPLTLFVTDTLPTHVTHITATGVITWTPAPLNMGEVWTVTVPVLVQWGYSGTLTNVVDVTSAEGATGTFTLLSEAWVTPAVSVTKQVSTDPVQAGDTLTYTIYVTNTGNVTLNLTITDILPAHVTHVTATNTITWTPVLTAPDDTWSTQFTVTVEWGYSGTLTNRVDVTSAEGATDTYTLVSQARVTPAMSVTKEVYPPGVYAGGTLTYTIFVTNTGNVTLTTTITDFLDPNVAHVTATNVLTWTPVLTTAPGDTWSTQFTVTVEAGYPGTVTNVVLVYADEGATGVATATALSYAPSVTITKWADPPVVQAGDQLTYTIVVTNNGTLALYDLVLTDTLPPEVSPTGVFTWPQATLITGGVWAEQVIVTAEWGYSGTLVNDVVVSTTNGVSATYSETSYVVVTPAVSVTKQADAPAVLAGDPITFTIYVTNTGNVTLTATVTDYYPVNATPGGTITWTRQLTQFTGTWVVTTVVTPNVGYAGWLTNVVVITTDRGVTDTHTEVVLSLAPYLSVTKQVSDDPVQAGDMLTYTIYVTNTGTMDLHLTVTDTLPSHVTHITATGTLTWTPAVLPPGGVWTATVPVLVHMGYSGTLTNTVEVTSTEGATDTFTLLSEARVTPALSVTKHVYPAIVEPGADLTYTIWVTNTGNVTLTATVTDFLDPNVTHITATSVLTWTPVLTAPDGTWSAQFTVTANAAYVGPLSNVVSVTTDEGATGSDTALSSVCVPFANLTLQGPTLGAPSTIYAFTATVAPPTVTMPITYTWEATGYAPQEWSSSMPSDVRTFSWAMDGTYVVTVTVDNDCGGTISRTHVITISACPFPLTDVTVGGPGSGYVNTTYVFTSVLVPPNASTPVTYTWSPPPSAGPQGQPDAQYQWATPGSYDITLEVENCGGTVSNTHTIVIDPPCIGVSGAAIAGPRSGISNTLYTFVANVSPAGASTPMTYTWSPAPVSGQGTATAQYQWPVDGVYTISVTVENCGGTVSDDHTITIQPVQPVYLPLVMRNYFYAPDLEVTAIQIFWGAGANPDYVQIAIRNNGPAPVTTDFWVDLYLDPSRVPTVGDLWNDLGSQGKAWFVRNPTILPGGTMVLDTRDPDDPADPLARYSNWPDQLPAGGHAMYAQADSYWRPSGMIIETDETNNVLLQTYVQGMSQSVVPTPPPPPVLDTPVPISTPKPRPTPEEQPTPEP